MAKVYTFPTMQSKAYRNRENNILNTPAIFNSFYIFQNFGGLPHRRTTKSNKQKCTFIICYMDSATGVGAGARQTVGFINFASLRIREYRKHSFFQIPLLFIWQTVFTRCINHVIVQQLYVHYMSCKTQLMWDEDLLYTDVCVLCIDHRRILIAKDVVPSRCIIPLVFILKLAKPKQELIPVDEYNAT